MDYFINCNVCKQQGQNVLHLRKIVFFQRFNPIHGIVVLELLSQLKFIRFDPER